MFCKIIVVCALVAVCKAGLVHHGHHSHHIVHHEEPKHEFHHHEEPKHEDHHEEYIGEYDPHTKYHFKYGVEDPHSGDYKTHHETREGDVVKGEYSLLQPDGSFRKVTYVADPHTGFHAEVHNTPPVHHHE